MIIIKENVSCIIKLLMDLLEKFERCSAIDEIVLVCQVEFNDVVWESAERHGIKKLKHVINAEGRIQEYTKKGIQRLSDTYSHGSLVLIYDAGAKTLDVSEKLISNCIKDIKEYGLAGAGFDNKKIEEVQKIKSPNIFHK